MAFEYPVWGVVEGVAEPINTDWRRQGWWCRFRGASRRFGHTALVLVLSRRLARRGVVSLSGGVLSLAFLP